MASPLAQIKEIWNRLPMSGRIATVGGMAATLGLIVALVYFGSQTEYAVLFSDLKPADAQTIIEKLKAANVPYSIANGGATIQVLPDKVSELRLQMASEGVISGGHVGFDLFDKTNFGATDFAQQVNYRRAIEGELAKTLEGMDEIESARVHLTPKKESVFTEKEEGAKASVMVKVKQNKELSSERSDAIVSLIASSIEGLEPSSVSVMDTRGRLLVAAGKDRNGGSGDAGAFHAQLEAKQKYEMESAARIIALIEPVVGENRVRADVAADIDFSQVEQNEEKYNPQSQVIRSQQTSQEARNSSAGTQTAPVGARSNDPATTAPPAVVPSTPTTQSGDQRTQSTTNYEIDKTVKKTVGAGGRVNRMTVSVVVDHKTAGDTEVARTSDEIRQIQDLVAAAVGIDQNRGDSVVVQTMPFTKPQIETGTTASFFEKNKSLVSNLTKYGSLILIAALLLLFVIRPAHRALKAAAEPMLIEEPKLLVESSETEMRRENDMENAKQLENGTANALEPMTVAELEAKMNGETDSKSDVQREIERVESIKRDIATQTINDTDTVVSTLRGWLRETA